MSKKSLSDLIAETATAKDGDATVAQRVMVVGKSIMLFTAEFYYIGRVVAIDDSGVLLAEAVWVSYTGSLDDMISQGSLMTAAPLGGEAFIPMQRVGCVIAWNHPIPSKVIDQ